MAILTAPGFEGDDNDRRNHSHKGYRISENVVEQQHPNHPGDRYDRAIELGKNVLRVDFAAHGWSRLADVAGQLALNELPQFDQVALRPPGNEAA